MSRFSVPAVFGLIAAALLVVGGAARAAAPFSLDGQALATMSFEGIDLPTTIRHYIAFAMSPQIYLWKNFAMPKQIAATQEKVLIKKAPSGVKIETSPNRDNLQKIRDYLETI